ncbi:NAD(P)H-quinone oxidoreductase [Nesterenkonia sp. E16_7]|uniref:NAD(P)H-quinone oxidoreductase n=1 Tax=unclassified Nesterenkonia TaxID=2629769 RepID=UPI001A924B82|nr:MULTISPECIES: NAD(P)H-quinone oxidoreductase [unclassified Nesterenkonia]MBO0594679.1 NAD(P)H-quinone oxidoreductase [Nesterenkonia sp. E16_10]MBO0597428.1 NAD(P)H-quinone oxidoreductase [Nesterenkonia sp. E16_7]
MRAVHYTEAGGPEVITLADQADPTPAEGQVLIEVAAAGLNRADVMQRLGVYPPPKGASEIPGLEVSGRVLAAGPGADVAVQELIGKEVVALLAGGGYAEKVVVDARHVLPIPAGVSLTDAAGLIEVAATVHSNLRGEAQVQPGDSVLVHGGTGGIGSFALQYLHGLGAKVLTTVGSAQKASLAVELGADHVINYREEDLAARVQELTEGRGVDVIFDVVGAKYLETNLRSLATGGRLVIIGLQGGRTAELDLGLMLAKRLRIIATTLRARDAEAKAEIVQAVGEEVWPLIESGQIRIQTDKTFPLDEVAKAHEYFDSGTHTGKILLTMT